MSKPNFLPNNHPHQQIIKDFPWLWAVLRIWPPPQSIRISNDNHLLIEALRLLDLKEDAWVRFIFLETEHVLPLCEATYAIGKPLSRPIRLADEKIRIDAVRSLIRGGAHVYNFVFKFPNGFMIFRHPQKTSYNSFLEEKVQQR